jgi:hypothetical protein
VPNAVRAGCAGACARRLRSRRRYRIAMTGASTYAHHRPHDEPHCSRRPFAFAFVRAARVEIANERRNVGVKAVSSVRMERVGVGVCPVPRSWIPASTVPAGRPRPHSTGYSSPCLKPSKGLGRISSSAATASGAAFSTGSSRDTSTAASSSGASPASAVPTAPPSSSSLSHARAGACAPRAGPSAAEFAAFLKDEVVADVGHAQWVFTVPKLLRPYFMHHRELLGPLCTAAWQTVRELMAVAAGEEQDFRPGMVAMSQTFGDQLNLHPHVHALVTRGGWTASGEWVPVPLRQLLRCRAALPAGPSPRF